MANDRSGCGHGSVAAVNGARHGRPVRVTPAGSGRADEVMAHVVDPGQAMEPGRHIVIGEIGAPDVDGRRHVEVVVDGWRFEWMVEDEELAALRERASRDRGGVAGAGGPLEIRAIIPGRVASVAVTPGDRVELGQTLLAVEAMKMQNELRAPRSGTIARVPATAGSTVELGDVLVVIE
jgi:biotin carboxyl carrier protein